MTPPTSFVRTPDKNFDRLPDWPYKPRYAEIDGLRVHYIDEGRPNRMSFF